MGSAVHLLDEERVDDGSGWNYRVVEFIMCKPDANPINYRTTDTPHEVSCSKCKEEMAKVSMECICPKCSTQQDDKP